MCEYCKIAIYIAPSPVSSRSAAISISVHASFILDSLASANHAIEFNFLEGDCLVLLRLLLNALLFTALQLI